MAEKDIEKVLISKEEILAKSAKPNKRLVEEYQGKNPLVVGILKGAVPLMADLIRETNTYLELDFMDVSSYGSTIVFPGEVKIIRSLDTNVKGKHILVIEDITDNDRTLVYLVDSLRYRKVTPVKVVTLLGKPEGRVTDTKADYVRFDVSSGFVISYRLDYTETYRNLPYIGVLRPEIYESN